MKILLIILILCNFAAGAPRRRRNREPNYWLNKLGREFREHYMEKHSGRRPDLAVEPLGVPPPEETTGTDVRYTLEQARGLYERWREQINANGGTSRKKRKVTGWGNFWSDQIPYKFDGLHNSEEKSLIRKSIGVWEAETCLDFTELSVGDPLPNYYLIFTKSGGCWSYIGKAFAGGQPISLSNGCLSPGTIQHEIGHAMGFHHEQNRADRDEHVLIAFENIQNGWEHNFIKEPDSMSMGVPYDFGSMMHYTQFAVTTNGQRTIIPYDDRFNNVPGQRFGMSFADAKAANAVYCSASCAGSSLPCKFGGYPDPHNCSKCRCTPGRTGTLCEELQEGSPDACGGYTILLEAGKSHALSFKKDAIYSAFQRCSWSVEAPVGETITVTIDQHGSTTCSTSGYCRNYFELRGLDGDFVKSGPRLCKCNFMQKDQMVTENNKIDFLFRAESGNNGVGFQVTFSASSNTVVATTQTTTQPTTTSITTITAQPSTTTTSEPTTVTTTATTATTTTIDSTTSSTATSSTTQSSTTTTQTYSCANGLFVLIPGTDCVDYYFHGHRRSCHHGLKFDYNTCTCNWPWAMTCPA